MATSQIVLAFGAGFAWSESALGAVVKEIKASGATAFIVEIDNSLNPSQMVYLKAFFALAAGVTLGTTDPNLVLPVPGGQKVTYKILAGAVYPTALSVACVTTGGTAGTTAPPNSVLVKVAYS